MKNWKELDVALQEIAKKQQKKDALLVGVKFASLKQEIK